jgi:hypothetical protein
MGMSTVSLREGLRTIMAMLISAHSAKLKSAAEAI